MFTPRNLLAVFGTMLFLIAFYLVLEKAGGFSQIIGGLAAGGLSIIGALQGRNVFSNVAGGISVTGTP